MGTDEDALVRLDAASATGTLAIITLDSAGSAAVRRAASGARVLVNGVALGDEPAPLLHGDRISVGGREMRFADDRHAGSTVVMPKLGTASGAAPPAASAETAASGGRLVSLVDGREYRIGQRPLRLGRDAGCDVVVPGSAVSREHAEIASARDGYRLRDLSANGVFVNGERLAGTRLLRRGDVVRVGTQDFRFHAEQPPAPTPLARLTIVNEGVTRGQHFDILAPLAHVGRGAHNDVAIADESVSDSHAKLQRRESGWVVVDMGSTNGTYVNGRRVTGERAIESGVELRFGGVKLAFRPALDARDGAGSTRVVVGLRAPDPRRATPVRSRDLAQPARGAGASPGVRRAVSPLVWLAAAAAIGAAVLFALQDR